MDIDIVLKDQRMCALEISNNDLGWAYLGKLEESLDTALRFMMKNKEAGSRDISKEFKLAINTASNQLNELSRMKLIDRVDTPGDGITRGRRFQFYSLF